VKNTPLLADLHRAIDLLKQVDESKLEFLPDAHVSEDVQESIGLDVYPVESHLANMQARVEAVMKAGDQLESRAPSDYVSKLIIACVRLAPPSDD
jgi:hypothetical protein